MSLGPLSSSRISASTRTFSRYGCPATKLPFALCASTRPNCTLLPGSACGEQHRVSASPARYISHTDAALSTLNKPYAAPAVLH